MTNCKEDAQEIWPMKKGKRDIHEKPIDEEIK